MYRVQYIIKHIYRRIFISIAIIFIVFSFVVLINEINSILVIQTSNLKNVKDNFPIKCVISDIRGGKTDKLHIHNHYLDIFRLNEYDMSKYVKDVCFKRTMNYIISDSNEILPNDIQQNLIGITRIDATDDLSPENGVEVQFGKNYSEKLLSENKPVCIINKNFLKSIGKEIGDYITLSAKDLDHIGVTKDPTYVKATILIIGTFSGGNESSIYCSWDLINELGYASSESLEYSEKISFMIADNSKLNDIKNMAQRYFTNVDITNTKSEYEFALTIYDNNYIQSLASINKNIIFINILKPFIFIISFCISIITSFLTIRNRKLEFGIMRSLGQNKKSIFLIVITEQVFLFVLGFLAGFIALFVHNKELFSLSIINNIILLTCFFLGTSIAVYHSISSQVMLILKSKE